MVEKITFDKLGHKVLPRIKFGNERLAARPPQMSGGSFVACEDHGTVPLLWLRAGNTLMKCCRHCIRQHCQITTAILYKTPALSTEHPNGHSY